MKRQKRRYRKELQQAKTIIQKLMYGDQLVCEFCTYEADQSSPCANGDKEWCKTHATWKGLQKNKRITNEKTTALKFRAVFLMLSFQCLRELERITGFETQDGVKSFFGYPEGLLTPCFEKSRTLEFTGFAVSVFSNSFDAFLKITSFSVCLHAYIWAPMMLNKCSYSRVELYIFACDLLSQKLFINIFRFRKTCL